MSAGRFVDVREFPELDSTSRYVMDEARRGAAEGLVAVADHQTAGRGRMGRRWEAPPRSSLLLSVLLRPPLGPGELHLATAAVALSAVAACRRVAGVEPACKWPNDLVVDDRKLAGVLAEVEQPSGDRSGEPAPAVVIGIGINLLWPGPEGAGGISLYEVSGHEVSRPILQAALLEELEPRRQDLGSVEGRTLVGVEFRRRCATLGRRVRVQQAGGVLQGTAVDLTDEGHLVVETSAGTRRISAGDVVHLRDDPDRHDRDRLWQDPGRVREDPGRVY